MNARKISRYLIILTSILAIFIASNFASAQQVITKQELLDLKKAQDDLRAMRTGFWDRNVNGGREGAEYKSKRVEVMRLCKAFGDKMLVVTGNKPGQSFTTLWNDRFERCYAGKFISVGAPNDTLGKELNRNMVVIEDDENAGRFWSTIWVNGQSNGAPENLMSKEDYEKIKVKADAAVSSLKSKLGVFSTISEAVGYVLEKLIDAVVVALTALTMFGGSVLSLVSSETTASIQPQLVTIGWTTVRDIMNMFFVLAMIAMSLATILQIESYNYKKLLTKLIIMALLINFSKVIADSLISVSDMVAHMFLEGARLGEYGRVFSGLISEGKGLGSYVTHAPTVDEALVKGILKVITALTMAVSMLAIAGLLFIRLVGLWVLTILSPVAYALNVLPATESYAKKWWETFLKYLIWSPVAMFFLWLGQGLLAAKGSGTLTGQSMFDMIFVIAFFWAAVLVAQQAGMVGSEAIIKGAQGIGYKLPMLAGKHGGKALVGLGAEKLLEKTGVEIRPAKWIEGWKKSRELSREAREAKGAAKALDRKSALASPATFFQRYWHPQGVKRVLQGGEKKGRELLKEAEELKKQAVLPDNQQMRQVANLRKEATRLQKEAETSTGLEAVDKKVKAQALLEKANEIEKPFQENRRETLRKARALESTGKKLISPDDYLTQQKVRGAIDEEMHTIHTNNWHELVDLFESAEREGKPIRAAAILQHLTKTFNENELVNSSKYTRKMSAEESADGKEHQADEHFEYSVAGMDNFRKLIMQEKMGLGEEASKMIMSDVSDMAEDSKHFEIMRMYVSENGKLRLKRPDEREPEVSAELDKMGTNKVLSDGNRLAGSREVPDADYDIYQTRTTHIEPTLVAYYLKNYAAVKFLLNRGQMNPSQAKAVAEKQNREIIMKAANLLDDDEEVEPIVGVTVTKNTRRQQYIEIMNQLFHYGATKGASPTTGKSRIEEVQELFNREVNDARNARKAAKASERGI